MWFYFCLVWCRRDHLSWLKVPQREKCQFFGTSMPLRPWRSRFLVPVKGCLFIWLYHAAGRRFPLAASPSNFTAILRKFDPVSEPRLRMKNVRNACCQYAGRFLIPRQSRKVPIKRASIRGFDYGSVSGFHVLIYLVVSKPLTSSTLSAHDDEMDVPVFHAGWLFPVFAIESIWNTAFIKRFDGQELEPVFLFKGWGQCSYPITYIPLV